MQPLVSCIMATKNRRKFIPQALRCFANRTYANAELLVIDDSDRPVEALCRDVPGVRYIRLTEPTPLGTKMNLGIAEARGDILQKIDDDDYYAPRFLASSVANLPRAGRASTIVTRCCFLVLLPGRPEVWDSGHGWRPGGAFCFHRALWKKTPFRDAEKSVDSLLLRDTNAALIRVCDVEQYIVVRHGKNTWNWMKWDPVKLSANEFFESQEVYGKPLEELVPAGDAAFYRKLLRA